MMLWKAHFAPTQDCQSIQVPYEWINFIILALSSPDSFDWCKDFMKSNMWQIIAEADHHKEFIPVHIPDSCPLSQAPACQDMEMEHTSKNNTPGSPIADKIAPPTVQYRRKRRDK